jgi:hypothetical protein
MPDDKTIRSPEDNKQIDINDPIEIANWCKSLGCTVSQLKTAVAAVGKSAKKVKDFLRK